MRSALVVVEIAASIVLLVGAALLARSLAALVDTDLGVNTESVLTAQLDLGQGRTLTQNRQVEIAQALRDRIAAMPSVRSVGFGSGLPPNSEYFRMSFVLNNSANTTGATHIVTTVPASPEYFSVLQIPITSGRYFTDADAPTAPPVGIVNRVAARQFFGDDDPIGRALPSVISDHHCRRRREREIHRHRQERRGRAVSALRAIADANRRPSS